MFSTQTLAYDVSPDLKLVRIGFTILVNEGEEEMKLYIEKETSADASICYFLMQDQKCLGAFSSLEKASTQFEIVKLGLKKKIAEVEIIRSEETE